MSSQYHINLRLPFRFKTLKQDCPAFNDCIIQLDSKTEFQCCRILLAKASEKIKKYFIENPKKNNSISPENVVIIPIHNVDDNSMSLFLELLYNNYLKVTVYNIASLLNIAYKYEFTEILKILRVFYMDAANDENYLHLATEFIKFDLEWDAKALAPLIATHLVRIENHDKTEKNTLKEIYEALSPPVFSSVLIERNKLQSNQLSNQTPELQLNMYVSESLSNDVVSMIYIEEYVKYKGIDTLTNLDKDELSKVINWEKASSYIYMIDFPCDWLPPKYSRKLIINILNKRRIRLKNLQKKIRKPEGPTSQWFVLSWIRTIQRGEVPEETIPVIEFIRTLGGSVPPFNPIKYGLICTNSSQPIMKSNLSEEAFIRNPVSYFISKTQDNKMPYIEFDLGPNVSFEPKYLYLDSRFCKKEYIDSKMVLKYAKNKGLVECVDVRATSKDNKIFENKHVSVQDPQLQKGSQLNIEPCSKMSFTLNGENSLHSDIFRVSRLDVFGVFTFQ